MPSGNFNPGVNFLLKNISDDDVEVTIIPAGQKDSIKTILGVGWNPEICEDKAKLDNLSDPKNLLAYGVEWDSTNSSPVLTRIGNMSLHKSLPIQSALRGCVCQGKRIMYYLDPNDWSKKADGTDLGKPRTNTSRANFRTYAKNAGKMLLTYEYYKSIFYWLYVIEYANFNSQANYVEDLTEDGYRQGGLGNGVTTLSDTIWNTYNGRCPITPCGYCNEFGNFTGIKDLVIPAPDGINTITFKVPRWRGFDNMFGDIWTNLDGILIDTPVGASESTPNYVYIINDPDKFTCRL